MNDSKDKSYVSQRIGYWVMTGLLVIGMVGGGIAQVMQSTFMVDGFNRLGYPLYSTIIIGTWKILGVIILLIPGFGLLKEWAYAGFFFLLSSAVVSHIASGDTFQQWVSPLTFALLTVGSWYLRPDNRRIKTTLHQ